MSERMSCDQDDLLPLNTASLNFGWLSARGNYPWIVVSWLLRAPKLVWTVNKPTRNILAHYGRRSRFWWEINRQTNFHLIRQEGKSKWRRPPETFDSKQTGMHIRSRSMLVAGAGGETLAASSCYRRWAVPWINRLSNYQVSVINLHLGSVQSNQNACVILVPWHQLFQFNTDNLGP